ncbi:U3 small nucleolar RNA-associated protein 18 homolog [Microplitis demolitor]|uniref:U3 small nucleolar RNA-associated protein 18 homolog n=1 Tax=Microplitis demolitor TaxID=69319 RepID=UPI0004CDAC66|nr:U3 small nucleolar RNA-associated protein 18 homolog [Microplitis demolitor]
MAAHNPKRQKLQYDPEAEDRLQKVAFKDSDDLIKTLFKDKKNKDVKTSGDTVAGGSGADSVNIETDEENDSDEDEESDEAEESDEDKENDSDDTCKEDQEKLDSRKRAWVDEDDENYSVNAALKIQERKLPGGRTEVTYNELLENKFQSLVGAPKWSEIKTKEIRDSDDSDEELYQHSNRLQTTKDKKLPRGIIDIKALKDINTETHCEGPVVTSLQFHPTSTVAFVAGLSGVLSIFKIDGQENNKLQSVKFERFNINAAKFLRDGNEIIAGTRNHSYSQLYDLMSGKINKIPLPTGVTNMSKFEVSPDGKFIAVIGKMGEIFLLSALTKELIHTFKMNKRCHAITFTPDTKKLITHGDSEEIYIWDINSRSCIHRAIDTGCISSTSIAISSSGQFLATGSKQGVVNLYETSSVLRDRFPKPSKIILNLVTAITSLKFNSTCEILAMGSKYKENAFKMVHLPSFNVFSNFPTARSTIYTPLAIDFSPSSGFMGISNNKGCAHLYRLKHYGNY